MIACNPRKMQRQKDACRFESDLVYLVSKFKVSQGYIESLCLNKQKPKTKNSKQKKQNTRKENLKRKKGRQAGKERWKEFSPGL